MLSFSLSMKIRKQSFKAFVRSYSVDTSETNIDFKLPVSKGVKGNKIRVDNKRQKKGEDKTGTYIQDKRRSSKTFWQ